MHLPCSCSAHFLSFTSYIIIIIFSVQFLEDNKQTGVFNGEPSVHLLKYSLCFFLVEFHRQRAGRSGEGAARGSAEAV